MCSVFIEVFLFVVLSLPLRPLQCCCFLVCLIIFLNKIAVSWRIMTTVALTLLFTFGSNTGKLTARTSPPTHHAELTTLLYQLGNRSLRWRRCHQAQNHYNQHREDAIRNPHCLCRRSIKQTNRFSNAMIRRQSHISPRTCIGRACHPCSCVTPWPDLVLFIVMWQSSTLFRRTKGEAKCKFCDCFFNHVWYRVYNEMCAVDWIFILSSTSL